MSSPAHAVPIRHRLRRNMVPSYVDRLVISASLDAARVRLTRLVSNGESEAPEGVMLRNNIAEHSSLLSKIRVLSDDILRLIFLHADIHDLLYTGSLMGHTAVEPYTTHIASVCAYWRAVVLDTPVFWASISASITTGERSLSLLRLFLERSQNAPLSLEIRIGGTHPLNIDIINTIMQHSQRWSHLVVQNGVKSPSSTYFLSSIPDGHLPLLESIAFTGITIRDAKLSAAPQLRRVSFEHISDMDNIPTLPWNQIRHLSAVLGADGRGCEPLLAMFPSVTHLTMRVGYKGELRQLPIPQPRPSIRALDLLAERVESAMKLLLAMNLPNLERLAIHDGSQWIFSSIETLIQRSGCQLKSLSLQNTRIRGDELLELLRILPALESLEISTPFPNAVVDLLLAGLTPGPQLVSPALTEIHIAGIYLFSTGALLTMMEARQNAASLCRALSIIDITLPDRVVAMADLGRFAALPSASFTSLTCHDEDGKWVRICNGRWLR